MADEVKLNDSFFEELGRSPGVTQLCREVAERVAATARATAPRDTGEYANSIRVEVVSRQRRNAVLVVAADPKAMLIESQRGTLARALKQAKKGG